MASPMSTGYPVTVDLDAPEQVDRWRPLVHWILVIPHWIVLYVLGIVSAVLALISFFTVLFTRRVPDGIYRFQAMYLRYQWRTISFAWFMRNPYPSFSFELVNADDGIDPAKLSIDEPRELNRWLPLIKWLLLIPHFIVLAVLGIVAAVVWIIGFFAVLVTGKWPAGLRDFMVGYVRWLSRVSAYHMFLIDEYPPFSLR